jgi:hypothetical protein
MKTLVIIYLSLVILALAACQKSNQDAVVPGITTDCLNNPNLCNSGLYQQSPGFTPYNYGGGYGGGYGFGGYYNPGYNPFLAGSGSLCACPVGTVPTYNNYSGLGCVQSTLLYGYAYISFGYASNNNQWTNIPQISNVSGYVNQGCFNSVVQSCLVGDANSCGTGSTCRINSASSRLGVCISNSTGLMSNSGLR